MAKKLTLWVALIMVMSLLGTSRADLVGHWKLDEGSGTVAADSSGNGNNGTFVGAPTWVAGQLGGAIEVGGSDWIDCGNILELTTGVSIACWVNPTAATGIQGFAARSGAYALKSNGARIQFTTPGILDHFGDNFGMEGGTWQHVAATFVPGQAGGLIFYRNGVETDRVTSSAMNAGTGPVLIGSNQWSENLIGMIDDVRIYDHILTPEEVLEAMRGAGKELAAEPSPEDAGVDVPRDVVLGWKAGEFAVTHDVYFGTVFDDVNDASRANQMGVLVSQNQAALSYDPDGLLDFGQTYYWRVDEVNGAPDNTIFKGEVWSFSAEPFAYAVQGVIATSNTTSQPGQGPDRLVDGSGLNANDQHSNDTGDMWGGTPNPTEPSYLLFEFDRVYKMQEMLVWNYNMQFEGWLGMGVKNATVDYSENGTDWTFLADVEFARAPGTNTYTYGTAVPLEGVAAKYVRLTIGSAWLSTSMYGLSEVRFMYIPAHAREPQPADGAVDVALDVALTWRAGREATSHEVYLGNDPNVLTLAGTTSQSSYSPALDLDTAYYWRVDEVNPAEAITTWAGDVWSFTTQEYLVVDDFESYTDDWEADEAIWQTWIDGWEDNANGSQVGYATSPFAEQTIVHSGDQSMPLFFDNTGTAAISQAERALAPAQNWTTHGVKSLSLWFHGAAGNAGQLYVKVNGTRIDYDGDAADIARGLWQPWNIDLAEAGNLGSVTTLTVGVAGSGSGVVYVDDIRLYSRVPQYTTPAQPGTANLVAYYALDGDATDSSGNGFHGVVNGAPSYVAGVVDQAINLRGVDDHVVIAGVGIGPGEPRTVCGWAKADRVEIAAWTDVFGFTGPSVTNGHFDIQCVGDTASTTLGYYGLHRYGWESNLVPIDLEWHHLGATYDGAVVSWYGDGQHIGSVDVDPADFIPPGQVHIGKRQDNTNHFPGTVDEVRIYNQALTPEEFAGLAGRTVPLHVPF